MNDKWWMTAIRENVVMKGSETMRQVPEYVLTPSPVIEIVCDGDHWAKSQANGGRLRSEQHVIRVSWLEYMPFVTAENDSTLPKIV